MIITRSENDGNKKIRNIFSNLFTIVIIIIAVVIYRQYDFNFFTKGILGEGKTQFSRDANEKYSKTRSYKIDNILENDAMFFRTVPVTPNTPYKVTCMVKTKNIENSENNPVAGAQICLTGTEEHSEVLTGDNDWTKLEFYFNSKNNTEVEIGFRLGGNLTKASGTAWYSDLSLEKGVLDDSNIWNMGCFIIENTNIQMEEKNINQRVSYYQKLQIESDMRKFQDTIKTMSNNKINIKYEVINITEPLTTLTYDDENGYYIGEKDVYNLINDYVKAKEFDHIYICSNIPLESKLIDTSVSDWIGLGNMMYEGKGLSDIRIMDENYNYSSKDTFSEEVYIHEFLHTLERNAKENGYEIPALHDNEKYGYKEDKYYGLKNWYTDYINMNINNNGTKTGLPEQILTLKPPKENDFEYSSKLKSLNEPSNIVETIRSIMDKIQKVFEKSDKNYVTEGASQ